MRSPRFMIAWSPFCRVLASQETNGISPRQICMWKGQNLYSSCEKYSYILNAWLTAAYFSFGETTTVLNDMEAPLTAINIDDNELLLVKDGRVVPKVCIFIDDILQNHYCLRILSGSLQSAFIWAEVGQTSSTTVIACNGRWADRRH